MLEGGYRNQSAGMPAVKAPERSSRALGCDFILTFTTHLLLGVLRGLGSNAEDSVEVPSTNYARSNGSLRRGLDILAPGHVQQVAGQPRDWQCPW